MKLILFMIPMFCMGLSTLAQGGNEDQAFAYSSNLKIESTAIRYSHELQQLVFTIQVEGIAGASVPTAAGQMDGAPVLGYVFPTTLSSSDVGFGKTEGIVAMALTSHPDFDDTPLWDENMDRNYTNDGMIWHAHWVVLVESNTVPGGLAVKQFTEGDPSVTLPPTNPGMPMYMDSPGFAVVADGNTIRVIIPAYRIRNRTEFKFDAVTAYMEVNASNPKLPLLGVYAVYSIASGDLSLPYSVE